MDSYPALLASELSPASANCGERCEVLPPISDVVAIAAPSAVGGIKRRAPRRDAWRRLVRFLGVWPISRLSHVRNASREICTSSAVSASARVSTDSPSRRKRSSSSRCGASFTVARLRGCRACATASAKVCGRPVAVRERAVAKWEFTGGDSVMMQSPYLWSPGSATGAGRNWSKRKRLDVGVLTYSFLFILSVIRTGLRGAQFGSVQVRYVSRSALLDVLSHWSDSFSESWDLMRAVGSAGWSPIGVFQRITCAAARPLRPFN